MGARAWRAFLTKGRVFLSQEGRSLALLALVLGVWLWLGLGPFAVGPSEWDDHYYCSLAIDPSPRWDAINRYAHVWALRVSYLVFGASGLALYPLLTTLGASAAAYVIGRTLLPSRGLLAGGSLVGLLAALLLPLHPAIFRYLDVPFADTSMAAASMWALAFAALAQREGVQAQLARSGWTALSGAACFLAVKCKEPGLAVLPAVLLLLASEARASTLGFSSKLLGRTVAAWLLGACAAWLLLISADAVFLGDAWYSLRPSTYARRIPPVPKKGLLQAVGVTSLSSKLGFDSVSLLSSNAFFGFTLTGVAGALVGFRRSSVVRALAFWVLSSLLFASLISVRFLGIHSLPRYLVVPGMPLAVLAAYFLVVGWERPPRSRVSALGLRGALVLAALGMLGAFFSASNLAARAAYFLGPVALIFFVATACSATDRLARRLALALALAFVTASAFRDGRDAQNERRAVMVPWDTLGHYLSDVRAAAGAPVRFGIYKLPKPHSRERAERRLVSRMPELATIEGHTLKKKGDISDRFAAVLTSPSRAKDFPKKAWRELVRTRQAPRRKTASEEIVVLVPRSAR